jgi:hypothetical protein
MNVKFDQRGGVANLSRQIVIEGKSVAVLTRGRVVRQRELSSEEDVALAGEVGRLRRARPKSRYGGSSVSDAMKYHLAISDEPAQIDIQVDSDPSDPPPREYYALTDFLSQLAK